jgi:two-component system NtrC family sensor kinase
MSWKTIRGQLLSLRLSTKLIVCLIGSMVAIFGLQGWMAMRVHRRHLEENVFASADRISDLIKRSTRYHMLRNDREALYHTLNTIGAEQGISKIRIFNEKGGIMFSTDRAEVGTAVDKAAEACYACHAEAQPLTRLARPDRFRIYSTPVDGRVLGLINPIENEPDCSNAACHAHPASQKILGVLDTNLSLARVDQGIAQGNRQLLASTVVAVLCISIISAVFVWLVVRRPVKELIVGTERVGGGDWNYTIPVSSSDEIGNLAESFNRMTRELQRAHNELVEWAQTLEQRVEQKSTELEQAHQQSLRLEKMASIGRLAAVVAHQINNPLAGILTYAKLAGRQVGRQYLSEEKIGELRSQLELIETESMQCGNIVRNLLAFARQSPAKFQPADINGLIERCLMLIQHQLELENISLEKQLNTSLPAVVCDAGLIQQVVLALLMNAVEAMSHGGGLLVESRPAQQPGHVAIAVTDNGVGIPPDVMTHLFEPFYTTKEEGRGVGLGLATALGIVQQHGGTIDVKSKEGKGSTFTVTLPVSPPPGIVEKREAREAESAVAPGSAPSGVIRGGG